jgi:PKD repeat protein
VILEVENDCGSDIFEMDIEVISQVTADFTSDVVEGCADFEVEYEDLSSGNVIDWEWEFEGGIPDFSTEQNPIVLYETPGTYGVTLTVFSRQGRYTDVKSDTSYIEVLASPVASYTYTIDPGNSRRVIFTNTSQSADSYEWDFGDGNTSTEENPIHTYADDDFYFVELTAFNICDQDFYEEEIEISSRPIAGFDADPMPGCEGASVQFTSQASDNTETWSWEFEGGTPSTSTEENPVIQYNTPGFYNVTQYVSNFNGTDTLQRVDYIEILALPTSEFTSQRTGNGVYSFTNNSSNTNGQRWDFGDGSVSSDNEPTHSYGSDGNYTVTLTTFNECDTVMSSETIQVVLLPQASAGSNVSDGCAQLSVQFQDLSSGQIDSYQWMFEGGMPSSSTDPNPLVEYSNRGVFDVQLIVTNFTGSDTVDMPDMIEVFDVPESNFTYTQDSLDVDFTNEANFADSVHYNFGDSNESGESNPSHSYTEAGNYMVTQVAFNNCGTDTTVQVISIEGAEPLAIIGSSTTTICVGDTVFYTDQSAGNPISWNWTFEGGEPATSSEPNPFVVYNSAGIFDVELEVDNGFGVSSSSLVDYVEVVAEPDLDCTINQNGLSINVTGSISGTIDSLEWDFGDGTFSSEINPEHEYEEEGTYTITVTVCNVCGSFTCTQEVTVMSSSVAEISSNQYKIYPNPAQNILFVESNAFNRAKKIDVFMTDIFGRNVRNLKTEKVSGNKLSVELNNFATGAYMLQVEVDGKMIFDKFVISR